MAYKQRLEPCKTTITVDAERHTVFDALRDPQIDWNGFVVPHFPKREALRVVEWVNACNADIGWEDQCELRWVGENIAMISYNYVERATWERIGASLADLGLPTDIDAMRSYFWNIECPYGAAGVVPGITVPEYWELIEPTQWGLYCIGGMSWTWEDWTPPVNAD